MHILSFAISTNPTGLKLNFNNFEINSPTPHYDSNLVLANFPCSSLFSIKHWALISCTVT